MPLKHKIVALVFNDYEVLDLMGPLGSIIPRSDYYTVEFVSLSDNLNSLDVQSTLKNGILTPARISIDKFLAQQEHFDSILIPGGVGVLPLMADPMVLQKIGKLVDLASNVFTVCTGSLLLAATGRLDGREATTNKVRFDAQTPGLPNVLWKKKARWVESGKFITSSGITAGMDAAFEFMVRTYVVPENRTTEPQVVHPKGDLTCPPGHSRTKAREHAHRTAHFLEYRWNTNSEDDPFA
ncbi:DJ-1/PfpI family protein [Meira miltonrushii]|uniref:DJ-1/PfpI family protein n=1 Tax=Meira miltonrushii TaxID=1280837 RepID=A0A316V5Z5_9BASI|nr:DJ-1/PfpI family protein [Meira miltonrushii]PWN32892.1 DJ-1/PfpI family protein [Meira miltonrushii]